MVTANYAREERLALCDLLLAVGPDEPTLCTGWRTRDLAAHLVVRDRRPDATLGIVLPPFAGHTRRVQHAMAKRPFEQVVELLRTPPRWSYAGIGPLDRTFNTTEYFIHHEDVRRALPGWRPRRLERAEARQLWSQSKTTARLALRRFPGRVELLADGYGRAEIGSAGRGVQLIGEPGELSLFVSGRQEHARVQVTGDGDLVDRIQQRGFGR